MSFDRQQSPKSALSPSKPGVLSTSVSQGPGRLLSAERRRALYDNAEPTEQLPSRLPPASIAGQLRVLELQRDNLNLEIRLLQAQVPSVTEGKPTSASSTLPPT